MFSLYNSEINNIKGFNNLEKYLLKSIQNEYVLITMGAGDISKFVLSFKDHKKVIKIWKLENGNI